MIIIGIGWNSGKYANEACMHLLFAADFPCIDRAINNCCPPSHHRGQSWPN